MIASVRCCGASGWLAECGGCLGIKAKSFNYDYAPQIEMIETKHIYMNISQEGKDDIDDLREAYMLAGVCASTLGAA